jgi:predicted lipoprotein with Yx(FWY)xxD motif
LNYYRGELDTSHRGEVAAMKAPKPGRTIALRWFAACAIVLGTLAPHLLLAQPLDLPLASATTSIYPPGVSVAATPAGSVYVDARGRTLYGLDMRTLVRWSADPAFYCKDRCADWQPLLAPARSPVNIAFPQGFGDRLRQSIASGAAVPSRSAAPAAETGPETFYRDPLKAPDWTVIAGPAGPQWVYKGWHMVYVRKGDGRASTRFDGAENLTWNTLKFVPPVPAVEAPAGIRAVFADGTYVLADNDGHALFTGACAGACDGWKPLAAGMASAGTGAWKVSNSGDRPQWTYRGKPVFVSEESGIGHSPARGEALRP